jgi:hypothetical protein
MIFEAEKKLFLDISSTNIDTLVPSLCQCVETRSIEVLCPFVTYLLTLPLTYIPRTIYSVLVSMMESW